MTPEEIKDGIHKIAIKRTAENCEWLNLWFGKNTMNYCRIYEGIEDEYFLRPPFKHNQLIRKIPEGYILISDEEFCSIFDIKL